MTSQQLNDAMYGAGITAGGIANTKTTFADIMASDAQSVADSIRNSNDPTLSAAVRQIYAAGARQIAAMAGAEQAAYNNHTLSFQKESDVQGLGFVQGTLTAIGTGGDGNKPTQGYIGSGQWAENAQFLFHNPDGKNHSVMGFDGVDMFLTW